MSNAQHRVLLPVEILRGQMVPETIIETFSSVPVVLLGYHEVPDQTAPGQARNQFEDKAQDELDDLVTAFEKAGGDVTKRLVFTHDAMKTFERLAVEHACDSVLLLNPAPVLEDVLVPIRGGINDTHIARLVGTIVGETDVELTLLHVANDDDGRAAGENLLEKATTTLEETGIHRSRVTQSVVVDDDPLEVMLEAANDHDLVVLDEDRPSVRELIFGDTSEIVAEQAVCPVLVVRRRYLEEMDDEETASNEVAG